MQSHEPTHALLTARGIRRSNVTLTVTLARSRVLRFLQATENWERLLAVYLDWPSIFIRSHLVRVASLVKTHIHFDDVTFSQVFS